MRPDPAASAFDTAIDTTSVTPPARSALVTTVSHKDLPLCCPPPDQALWNMHPRVYLPIEDSPNHEATCPYCGAQYRLEPGARG